LLTYASCFIQLALQEGSLEFLIFCVFGICYLRNFHQILSANNSSVKEVKKLRSVINFQNFEFGLNSLVLLNLKINLYRALGLTRLHPLLHHFKSPPCARLGVLAHSRPSNHATAVAEKVVGLLRLFGIVKACYLCTEQTQY
jgi:hypothetical protein